MPNRYAARTEVSTIRSRDEIERTLRRYGANQFVYGWQEGQALVGFLAHDRQIRFLLPMPAREDFQWTPTGRRKRSEAAIDEAWEQGQRQAWRALALVVKAKLEAVEAGIAEFEDEFMAYIVLPGGTTVSEQVRPSIAQAYETGKLGPMLPALGSGK